MNLSAAPAVVRRVREEIEGFDDLALAGRMLLWAACVRVLKYVVPLPTLVRILKRPATGRPLDDRRQRHIVTLARWACHLIAWSARGNCLERGLVTYRYLSAAGAVPVLVVGVNREDGHVRGHAWVVTDGELVGEDPGSIERFAQVAAFDRDGKLCSHSYPSSPSS